VCKWCNGWPGNEVGRGGEVRPKGMVGTGLAGGGGGRVRWGGQGEGARG
jgi:hypothetical protein